MLSRRKLFGLIAGALAAPKALLPLQMKTRQPGITAPNGCGGYKFGFTGWKEMPETVFEPKGYSQFIILESTSEGRDGFTAWSERERARHLEQLAKQICEVAC